MIMTLSSKATVEYSIRTATQTMPGATRRVKRCHWCGHHRDPLGGRNLLLSKLSSKRHFKCVRCVNSATGENSTGSSLGNNGSSINNNGSSSGSSINHNHVNINPIHSDDGVAS